MDCYEKDDNPIDAIFELSNEKNIDVIIILYALQTIMANQPISSLIKPLCDALQPIACFLNTEVERQHKLFGGDVLDIQIGLWYSIVTRYYEIIKKEFFSPEFAYMARRFQNATALCDRDRIRMLFSN
jgi:hypothetical protein